MIKTMPQIQGLLTLLILVGMAPFFASADPPPLQEAQTYTGEEEITGWYMSEKLDGIRGIWTGSALITRKGNPIYPPPWFTRNLPPFELDGELWSKRGDFNFIQSTVMDKTPSDDWGKITYQIFEVPHAPGNFPRRLAKAEAWLTSHPDTPVHIIPQIPCAGPDHLSQFMAEITSKGGEGLMVKDPDLPYHTGSSPYFLKVKQTSDMDGVVIKINGGEGKYQEMMGSLRIELKDGTTFKLGTGFTDEERRNPPSIGTVVTFRHHGFTEAGIPRFASYLSIRDN